MKIDDYGPKIIMITFNRYSCNQYYSFEKFKQEALNKMNGVATRFEFWISHFETIVFSMTAKLIDSEEGLAYISSETYDFLKYIEKNSVKTDQILEIIQGKFKQYENR